MIEENYGKVWYLDPLYPYIIVIVDKFSKNLWAIPLKNKYSQTITNEFPNILTTSKRKPLEIESDGGSEFYNNVFQKFLKVKNIHHYSRFTDKYSRTSTKNLTYFIKKACNFSKKC